MKIVQTALCGVLELTPAAHGDSRGWFMESYRHNALLEAGVCTDFVQDNQSFSQKKGTLRGLHCQAPPYTQAKLVRVLRGAIRDVVVDIRVGSPSYLKWIAVELSAENRRQLFVPEGLLHGFVSLTDDVELFYKCNEYYNAAAARSIRWNDPALGVQWGIDSPILSRSDQEAPTLADSGVRFTYQP